MLVKKNRNKIKLLENSANFKFYLKKKIGEFGADRIYAGQMAILGKTSVGPTIKVTKKILIVFL